MLNGYIDTTDPDVRAAIEALSDSHRPQLEGLGVTFPIDWSDSGDLYSLVSSLRHLMNGQGRVEMVPVTRGAA
jgi:hypothetical protein